jgi:hypothetical protein
MGNVRPDFRILRGKGEAMTIPFEQYRAMEGLNWSLLKEMDHSPARFRMIADEGSEDTYSRGALRAVHCRVLEGAKAFEAQYGVFEGRRQGPRWELAKAAAEMQGRYLLNEVEWAQTLSASKAILCHPAVREVLTGAHREHTLQWAESGLAFKGRLDGLRLRKDSATVIDLKAVPSTLPRKVASEIARRMYHGQLAHYAAGVTAKYGVRPEDISGIIIGYENVAPYDVGVFELSSDQLYLGEVLRNRLIERYKACEVSGQWGPRATIVQDLALPSWAGGGEDEDDTETERWT